MDEISYIHAADFHLDSPCKNTGSMGLDDIERLVENSSLKALDNLAILCESKKPDFLLIAGDLYNEEMHDLSIYFKFKMFCEVLSSLNIKIFIVNGNHDPHESMINNIKWPDNVHFFSVKGEEIIFEKDGRKLAVIHGFSLSKSFNYFPPPNLFRKSNFNECFHIGLLHCGIEGIKPGDNCPVYTIEELKSTDIDAFALGHKHKPVVLNSYPLIAYSGCLQGNDKNSMGTRGCFYVKASNHTGRWLCEHEFYPLNAIQWEKMEFVKHEFTNIDDLSLKLKNRLSLLKSQLFPNVSLVFISLYLNLSFSVASFIYKNSKEYLKNIFAPYSNGFPSLFLNDFQIITSSNLDEHDLDFRNGMKNEVIKISNSIYNNINDNNNFLKFNNLDEFQSNLFKDFSNEDWKKIVQEAQCVCQNCLEG